MNVIGDLDVKLRRDHTGQKFRTKSTILDIFAMAAIISSSTLILYSFYVTIRLGKVINYNYADTMCVLKA